MTQTTVEPFPVIGRTCGHLRAGGKRCPEERRHECRQCDQARDVRAQAGRQAGRRPARSRRVVSGSGRWTIVRMLSRASIDGSWHPRRPARRRSRGGHVGHLLDRATGGGAYRPAAERVCSTTSCRRRRGVDLVGRVSISGHCSVIVMWISSFGWWLSFGARAMRLDLIAFHEIVSQGRHYRMVHYGLSIDHPDALALRHPTSYLVLGSQPRAPRRHASSSVVAATVGASGRSRTRSCTRDRPGSRGWVCRGSRALRPATPAVHDHTGRSRSPADLARPPGAAPHRAT
jgi:hypothetical protein